MAIDNSEQDGLPMLMGSLKRVDGQKGPFMDQSVLKDFVEAYRQTSMMRVFELKYSGDYAKGIPALIITATKAKSTMADCKVLQPLLLTLCNRNIGTFCALYDLRTFVAPPLNVLVALGLFLRPRLHTWKWDLVAAAVILRDDKWGRIHRRAVSTLLKLAPPKTAVGLHHTEAEAIEWLQHIHQHPSSPSRPRPVPVAFESENSEQDSLESIPGSCFSSIPWFRSWYAVIACTSYLIVVSVCLLCYPDAFHSVRDPAWFATPTTLLGSAVVMIATVFVLLRLSAYVQECSQASPCARTNMQPSLQAKPRSLPDKHCSEVFEEKNKKKNVWPKLRIGFKEFKCPCVTRTAKGEAFDKSTRIC